MISVATHRLQMGRFTGEGGPERLALPVVGPQGGADAVHAPIRLTLDRPPDEILGAANWKAEVVDESTFRVIHGVALGRWNGAAEGLQSGSAGQRGGN